MSNDNKPKLRGLREIRTSTGPSTSEANLPQIYMRLCALEMERHRREHERRASVERAARCEERCAEIDDERRTLLETMAKLTQKRDADESQTQVRVMPGAKPPLRAVTLPKGGPRGKPASFVEPAPKPLTHRY